MSGAVSSAALQNGEGERTETEMAPCLRKSLRLKCTARMITGFIRKVLRNVLIKEDHVELEVYQWTGCDDRVFFSFVFVWVFF